MQTILHDIMPKYADNISDEFYIIIESDGENNPKVLTDEMGCTLKFYNKATINALIKTLNKSYLTHYYIEKITF